VRHKKLRGNNNIQFVKAKYGRLMMKRLCTESRHVESRFLKKQEGGNLVDVLDKILGFRFSKSPETFRARKD